jgi:hypothetical protein
MKAMYVTIVIWIGLALISIGFVESSAHDGQTDGYLWMVAMGAVMIVAAILFGLYALWNWLRVW